MSASLYSDHVKQTLHPRAAVSYEEKGQWVYIVVNAVTLGAYLAIVAGLARVTPVAEVDYVPILVATIVIAIGLSIAGRILVEIISQSETYKADARDRDIDRRGEYVGGILLGVGMIVPFCLAVVEAEYFWIANAIYLVFALSAFVGTAVKLVAYRRGL
jgi:predicted membrane channel-forming protein YqfA (hemolysin III family)